ncbi:MAG: hypothetical protein AAGF81_02980 [Pseudomonadota bacterium]
MSQPEGASSFFMGFVFNKFAIAALLSVYFLVLSVLYEKYISPIFGYRGFTIDRDVHKLGIALITIIVVSLFITVNKKPSSMIMFFYVILLLVPQLSFTYNSGGYIEVVVLAVIAYFVMYFCARIPVYVPNLRNVKFSTYEKVIYAFVFTVLVYAVYTLGYDHFSFKISDVYVRRALLEERYDKFLSGSIGLGFIFIVFLSIINISKNSLQVFIPLALGIIFFGLTGHKKFAILPIACVAIYKVVAQESKFGFYAVILAFIALGMYYIVRTIEYTNVMQNYEALFFTMFFARVLSIPAQLNDFYYDFFSKNGFLFWSYSKIGLGMFQYDFNWTPAQLVGRHMFTTGSANTGLVGSGYMNAGSAGVVIYAVIAGLTLAFVDKIAEMRGTRALCTMLVLPSFVIIFTTSDLPNVYFSQGFGLILLMLWLFRIDDQPVQQNLPAGQRSGAVPLSASSKR